MSFPPAGKSGLARRVYAQARPYAGSLAGILLLELASIPVALLLPVPLKLAVDSLTGAHGLPQFALRMTPANWSRQNAELLLAAALMIATGVVQHVLGFRSWLLQTSTSERMILDFRAQIFQHVQRLSLSFHDRKGTGDTTYRIQYDAPSLAQIAIKGVIPAITAVLMLVGMLYITARLDWHLAMIALVLTPCLFLVTHKYSDRVHDEWTEVRDRDSRAMSVLNETLGALRVVKAFGQERHEHRRFLRQSGKYVRGQMHLALLQSSFYALVGLTIVAGSAVGLVLGARDVRAGILTLGDLLIVLTYLGRLYEPLGMLSGKWVEVQAAFVSIGRAFALLDEIPEVAERPGAKALARAAGAVEFRNVSFHYDPRKPVLRNLTFALTPGAHVGILGHSGAGKTTLVSLLTRLYDPIDGVILLDGVDIREYKLAHLRDQFSIVLQEPVLFSTSIAENIAYTCPAASRDNVIQAAKLANAHDFISRLPNGYDTQVGARGSSLSGGERQRISLARAYLRDAPILILDEPTSSVDNQTEAWIVEATQMLMRGRTTFIITHRPRTLQHCELRFELRNGDLVPLVGELAPVLHGGRAQLALDAHPDFASAD
jgi:ATP-binding cassette subfamily B protein